VMVNPEHLAAARALKPMHERPVFGRSVLLFERVDRDQLEMLGEVRRPGIADLFVAVMTTGASKPEKADVGFKEEKGVVRWARMAGEHTLIACWSPHSAETNF